MGPENSVCVFIGFGTALRNDTRHGGAAAISWAGPFQHQTPENLGKCIRSALVVSLAQNNLNNFRAPDSYSEPLPNEWVVRR
jgi:hypothetical protein